MFEIEDEIHAEPQNRKFQTFEQALEILKERAKIPWNESPNQCPCTSWKTCERWYHIIEYDDNWNELDRQDILTISAKEIKWNEKIKKRYNI